jgi:trans-2,3-dihydro-3-hydroxyanthranilate isomerase
MANGEQTTAWLTTPPVSFGREIAREDAASILGVGVADVRGDLPAQLGGAGSPFLYVPLASKAAVDRAVLDVSAVREQLGWNDINGIYFFAQTDDGAYGRMFAPMSGIAEDPATGGATGPLYAYLAKYGALPRKERFVSEQGIAMGRPSVLHVRIRWNDDGPEAIEVGGTAVFVGEGRLRMPDESVNAGPSPHT